MVIPPGAFLFLRHGETEANAQEIICGKTDLPLTPRGRDQPVLIVAHSGTAREIHARLSPAPHRRLFNAEVVLWKPEAAGWCCHECFRPEG